MDTIHSLAIAFGLVVAFASGIALIFALSRVMRSMKVRSPYQKRRALPPLYQVGLKGVDVSAVVECEHRNS